MISRDVLLLTCLGYVALLFLVAFIVDQPGRRERISWLRSPVVYTLSLTVYCTSWTFYGAVGSAARNGLEFITIYLGPTLVFVGWFWLLRKLVRIGRTQRITSIADFISSRFGKSPALAVLVTVIAVIAITPYISLQLQSLTRSYQAVVGAAGGADSNATAFWAAVGLAVFTIAFGTRSLDANERHHGVVAAIALEAVVKLVALLAVGLYAVFGVAGGLDAVFADVPVEEVYGGDNVFGPRWVALMLLSATAVICLPRQFQVTVVENVDEKHLATAAWMFPLYLFALCLFVVPIAVVGRAHLPADASPDLYVLSLPLSEGRRDIALLAFIGGFSSATSMVIVASIAVSTMVSNHIVMPVALHFMSTDRQRSGDVRNFLLVTRRLCIAGVVALGLVYLNISGGSDSLAATGLIAFVGVAQFLPAIIGGMFWRGATRSGALAGMAAGFLAWGYTLFLPSVGLEFPMSASTLASGPFGIEWLRPHALFGLTGQDPLVHALVWSMGLNTLLLLVVSVLTQPTPLERLQGVQFIDVFRRSPGGAPRFVEGSVSSEALFVLAQRILGAVPARRLFDDLAGGQGRELELPSPTPGVISRIERELAGSIGAASANAMVQRVAGRETVGLPELIDIADETRRFIETSRALEEKSGELEAAAAQLRDANERLRRLDARKDEFLSQVSHELRTPMTSIRSFSELLRETPDLTAEERERFAGIIHDESLRLTRLLDEILDIDSLEEGRLGLVVAEMDPRPALSAAASAVSGLARERKVDVRIGAIDPSVRVMGNDDRLRQVLINLLTNAVKYNGAASPSVRVTCAVRAGALTLDVIDNGGGVGADEAVAVFDKFNRGRRATASDGAGLGLPISRAIMRNMNGNLTVEFADDGTSWFRATLPLAGA